MEQRSSPFSKRLRVPKHGQKSERKTAKRIDGAVRPGSGSVEGAKGDIMTHSYLLENKCTSKRSFSVKIEWLQKITKEAREEGKLPGLSIQFVDYHGNSKPHGRWVMIPESEFIDMIEDLR